MTGGGEMQSNSMINRLQLAYSALALMLRAA
jgi:hypothetical protein